jgi:hypothetical protein
MKTELRRACPNCGDEFSGAMGVTYKAVDVDLPPRETEGHGGASSADEFLEAALTWFGDPDPRIGTAWEKGERLAKSIAHRYLTKPVAKPDLLAAIHSRLERAVQ